MTLTLRVVRVAIVALLAAPLAAGAQPAGKVYRIGVLSAASSPTPVDQAFLSAMRRLGYVDGQNL